MPCSVLVSAQIKFAAVQFEVDLQVDPSAVTISGSGADRPAPAPRAKVNLDDFNIPFSQCNSIGRYFYICLLSYMQIYYGCSNKSTLSIMSKTYICLTPN